MGVQQWYIKRSVDTEGVLSVEDLKLFKVSKIPLFFIITQQALNQGF